MYNSSGSIEQIVLKFREFYDKLLRQSKFLFMLDSFGNQFVWTPACVYAWKSIHISRRVECWHPYSVNAQFPSCFGLICKLGKEDGLYII
jgi:hypothetical protein